MTTEIFDGKSAKQQILANLRQGITDNQVKPVLAIILVGDDPASKLYIRLKKEAGAQIGIRVEHFIFDEHVKEEEVIEKIRQINNDSAFDGLIVQLPLPEKFDTHKIITSIDPKKDVDGFHEKNQSHEGAHFMPVLPKAILFTLRLAFGNNFGGRKITALVNSEIFGRVLATFLGREGIDLHYIVRTGVPAADMKAGLPTADAIISACGIPGLIEGGNIKNRAVLIDAGIARDADGIIKGDVDMESVKGKAAFLTPVPGGIGPLTVAFLLENVYLSALKKHGK